MQKNFLENIKNYKVFKKIRLRLSGDIISLKPHGKARGNVLLSYITLPFVVKDIVLDGHTNRWESREITNIFRERGYSVDVIEWTNTNFIPKKKYVYFFDIHSNMERLTPLLNKDCIKIFHATTSHWKFQNTAAQKRLNDLQERKGVLIQTIRNLSSSRATEYADFISLIGNEATANTYAFVKEKITRIPLSTTHTYPSPTKKNFERAKNNFIWFGGSGMVHKGLDLVLEAFVDMPEYRLTVCGKVSNEKDFVEVYKKELYETPNINVVGLIDPGSREFKKLCDSSIALVYPSCSEGQSGAVVTTMHAGLIPIISYQSGVDVEDFGIILKESSIEEIKKAVRVISSLPLEEISRRAMKTWQYAREHHTREKFASAYRAFINMIEKNKKIT